MTCKGQDSRLYVLHSAVTGTSLALPGSPHIVATTRPAPGAALAILKSAANNRKVTLNTVTDDDIARTIREWPWGAAVVVQRIRNDMRSSGSTWWSSIRAALDRCTATDDAVEIGLGPLAELLLADPALKPEVAAVARGDPRVATAVSITLSPEETYDLIGGLTVVEAWRRNHARTSAQSSVNAPTPGWDFWAWELFLRWTIEPTPALWPALLHLIAQVDDSELMQVGIDHIEDLLCERPSHYAERLIESARADPRVARAVCI